MENRLEYKSQEILELTNELNEKAERLLNDVTKLNEMVKQINEKFDSCNHIWFISSYGHDEGDKNFRYNYTCVKCHKSMHVTEKYNGFCADKEATQYFLDVEQDPEYMFALYKELVESNHSINDLQIAGLIQSFVQNNQDIDDVEKHGVARRLKISPSKINRNVSYGE